MSPIEKSVKVNRRSFLLQAGALSLSPAILASHASAAEDVSATDRERTRSVAALA